MDQDIPEIKLKSSVCLTSYEDYKNRNFMIKNSVGQTFAGKGTIQHKIINAGY